VKYLLDTNVLSEPLTKKPSSAVLGKLARLGAHCVTATPVVHELLYGVSLLPQSRRRESVERYIRDVVLQVYPILEYTLAAAEWHALERARLALAGQPVPFVDGQIASIAHVNGLVLVTRNTKDFKRFPGLGVESWHS
jgi:tRNA(fMet)-specific endonuclease VapC